MRFIFPILLLAGVAILSAHAQSDLDNIPLSSSKSAAISAANSVKLGYRIEIRETSLGCFHHETRSLNIDGNQASIDGLGSVTLASYDVRNLDNYFEFVREYGEEGGCTTTDMFDVMVWSGEELLKSERLIDGTCSASLDVRVRKFWGARLTPRRIAYLIEQKKASQKVAQ